MTEIVRCPTRPAEKLHKDDSSNVILVKPEFQEKMKRLSLKDSPIYGELIVVGTNGELPCPPICNKMRHRSTLVRQERPTGVGPVNGNQASSYNISITANKKTMVMPYGPDPDTDMFQVGRSPDDAIDLVVVDTGKDTTGQVMYKANSTVSRYACRIICERQPPYTARLYAGAFDTSNRIKPSSSVPSWSLADGDHDCLTTNGVGLLRPSGCFAPGVKPGKWLEVSVLGNIYILREKRSSKYPGTLVPEETNILTDGCLIDLCGVTLIWRTAMGLEQAPSKELIQDHRDHLNATEAQCPVNFFTLAFPPIRNSSIQGEKPKKTAIASIGPERERQPWAYLACGHVCGYHEWKGSDNEDDRNRTCPTCRRTGPYVKLDLGQQRAYCLASDPPTHAFIPCGHVSSLATVRYWSSLKIPYSVNDWAVQCPFCLTPVAGQPYVKLIYS